MSSAPAFGDPRVSERVWSRLSPEPNSGCWLWFGELSRGLYPKLRNTSPRIATYAALVAPGHTARLISKCKNTVCCNPDHLRPALTADEFRVHHIKRTTNAALKRRYGIDRVEWERRLASQHGRCSICKEKFTPGLRTRGCVDHCHETNAVRDLLCGTCNLGLGYFGDSPRLLRAAAAYLEKHGKSEGE